MSLSPESGSVLLETLYPGSLYVAWVAARSPRGEGAPTAPIALRTQPLGAYSDAAAPSPARPGPLSARSECAAAQRPRRDGLGSRCAVL